MDHLSLVNEFVVAATKSAPKTSSSGASLLIFIVLLAVVFWFLILRPQRNRQRQQQQMMSQIAPGDEVVTIGGLIGTVLEMRDDKVVLTVAPGAPGDGGGERPVQMTFLRQAIARKVAPPPVEGAGEDDEDEEAEEAGSAGGDPTEEGE